MKWFLKLFFPPILLTIYRKLKFPKKTEKASISFSKKDYTTWGNAKASSTGYDENEILRKVSSSLLKVKNGEAVYERDSVIFDKTQYSWPLLASLLICASKNKNKLNLIDFGGSLGSTYYQNITLLKSIESIRWNIVEQSGFVACGKEKFQNKHLSFYESFKECLIHNSPNLIVFSSVLQYLPDPYSIIEEAISIKPDYILLDRTSLNDAGKSIIKVQSVSDEIYYGSFPIWFFDEKALIKHFLSDYKLISDFKSFCDSSGIIDTCKIFFKGYLFELKQ